LKYLGRKVKDGIMEIFLREKKKYAKWAKGPFSSSAISGHGGAGAGQYAL